MQHVLDNPVWNALISGDAALGTGTGEARYYDRQVSPFAGIKTYTDKSFETLYQIMPEGVAAFMTPVPVAIPSYWEPVITVAGYQFVFDTTLEPAPVTSSLTALTDEHVPQMLELTQLTKPGPFDLRTIRFGQYYGVFDGDKLVAMTGQRMHVFNYSEISAVCTHPDYLGRGYARQLLLHQIQLITAEGKIPFLHVRGDNKRAIEIYKSLGFSIRSEAYFSFVKK